MIISTTPKNQAPVLARRIQRITEASLHAAAELAPIVPPKEELGNRNPFGLLRAKERELLKELGKEAVLWTNPTRLKGQPKYAHTYFELIAAHISVFARADRKLGVAGNEAWLDANKTLRAQMGYLIADAEKVEQEILPSMMARTT
jgi:hypothetical protein